MKLQLPRVIVARGEFKMSLGSHINGDEGVLRVTSVLNGGGS